MSILITVKTTSMINWSITTKMIISSSNLISVTTIGGESGEENVGENPKAPNVCCEADRLVGQNFRSWRSGFWILPKKQFRRRRKVWRRRVRWCSREKVGQSNSWRASKVRKIYRFEHSSSDWERCKDRVWDSSRVQAVELEDWKSSSSIIGDHCHFDLSTKIHLDVDGKYDDGEVWPT